MLRLTLTAALALATASASAGQIGWWKFDDTVGSSTAADSAGSNTGAINAGAAISTGGISGNALDLTNPGSVTIPSALLTAIGNAGGNGTASIWIKPTAFGSYSTLFDSPGRNLSMWIDSPGVGYRGVGGSSSATTYSPLWTTGEWQHVGFVWQQAGGGSLTIYRNGVQTFSATGPGAVASTFNDVWTIGNNPSGGGSAFQGKIDDVQVYDSPLTSSQVAFLFNNPGAAVGVPEPSSLVLAGCGFLLWFAASRRGHGHSNR